MEQECIKRMEALSKRMDALEREIDELSDTMETQRLLSKAKGILMAAKGFTEMESHSRIRSYAMMKRMTMKTVAQAIISAQKQRDSREKNRGKDAHDSSHKEEYTLSAEGECANDGIEFS